MLKRTFHDLIEIKKKVAKLEKSKPEKSTKKRRRIIAISSSSEEEPSDTQSKCLERKDAPLPAVPSAEKPDKGKSSARPTSRHKPSDAKASRGGNKDPKSRTEPPPDSTSGADQHRSKKGNKKRSIKK
ncbi:uncharacterized protein LOC106717141 isoform X2 [Papilio machaon]|uniref:uncharacterized protein LOC106717141 isoform X2 n=1 Tax=Papilio machaon TaxID=76193 RepID=UPI001E665E23|nr:uncharacterized protein LOC106717141 isoform X2 [Papilio machaon]